MSEEPEKKRSRFGRANFVKGLGSVSSGLKGLSRGAVNALKKSTTTDETTPPPPAAESTKNKSVQRPHEQPQHDNANDALGVMMEQIAQISQQLADSRMREAELKNKLKQAEEAASTEAATTEQSINAVQEALQAQVVSLTEELKNSQDTLVRVRGQFNFQKVEQHVQEEKRLKAENARLTEEVEVKRHLDEELTAKVKELEVVVLSLYSTEKTNKELQIALEQITLEKAMLETQISDLNEERLRSNKFWQSVQHEWEKKLVHAKEEAKKEIKIIEEKCAEELANVSREMHTHLGKRNNSQKQMTTMKREMKRLLDDRQHLISEERLLRAENARLTLDVERKTRSLLDAMQALQMSQDAGGVDPTAPHVHQPRRRSTSILSTAANTVSAVSEKASSVTSSAASSVAGAGAALGAASKKSIIGTASLVGRFAARMKRKTSNADQKEQAGDSDTLGSANTET